MKISVCLITKNEEKMLEDCLMSVIDFASEIIVADTGSTDGTIEIAEKYGCKVFSIPWENDFAKARNFAIEQATGDYILSIDADERLLNPEYLIPVLEAAKSNTGGWLIEVVSEARRKDGSVDTYISNLLRLFINRKDIRFSGIIHEQIVDPILSAGLKIESTLLQIRHLGYSHSPEEMKKKQIRNLDLLNTALESDPSSAYNIFQRAKTFLALGNLAQAEQDIRKCLSIVNKDSAVYPQALNYGAVISYQLGSHNTAIERAKLSLGVIPKQSFANFILGESYSAQQLWNDALGPYFNMDEAQKNPDLTAHIAGDYYLPLEQLCFRIGKCYVGLKDYSNAVVFFQKGFETNHMDVTNIIGIANVEFFRKNYSMAAALIENAMKIAPDNPQLKSYLDQINQAASATSMESKKETYFSESDRPLLTLSMIVKNEEVMLEGCLQSVKGIADEIVIIDTGSNDETKEIAKKYNAKIYDFAWINDFAAARNESLKNSNGRWILYMDADERLSPQSGSFIRNMLNATPDEIDGFIVTIESEHMQLDGSSEMHSGGYPRLFRNYGYPTIKFEGRVHEQITPSLFALGKSIVESDLRIIHLGYNQTREIMEQKVKRNYALLIQHVKEEPLNGYAWYQLGQTLAQMNLVAEAENAIRFAIENGGLSSSVHASAAATLCQIVGQQTKYEEALHWAEVSLEKAPAQVYALHLRAYCLVYLKRFEEAEVLFHEVLKRLKEKQGVPKSGFDIDIPESVVLDGLNKAKNKIILKR